ncbi:MAG: hypothetical protein ACTSQP_01490, partial [Promethearchaeota archaeon]
EITIWLVVRIRPNDYKFLKNNYYYFGYRIKTNTGNNETTIFKFNYLNLTISSKHLYIEYLH